MHLYVIFKHRYKIMAEKPQRKRTVKKDGYIGRGAYGIVHHARLGKEVCAAKTLHSTLWDYEDPGADTYLQEFIKECNILKLLSHKNIVKYLGMYTDNETKMPVLLMELCDENLTKFLDNSPDTLPYHVELNIGHDIALALVYLHSKNLIHRDLSSNNVLMVKNNRVKVSDFGMSKLVRVNPNSPLSLCPGSVYYMSPQALEEPPNYTEKLDVFSAGVLLAQIMTRQSPKPSPRLRPVPGSENVYEVVPEIQRRAVELKLIRDSHPMKKVSIQCLEDGEEKRLSSEELEKSLKGLRQEDEYTESMEETHRNLHEQLQKLNEQIPRKRRSKHPSLSSSDDDGDMLKMKILLVGESGVGKTCIAQAYDGKDFQKRSHTLGMYKALCAMFLCYFFRLPYLYQSTVRREVHVLYLCQVSRMFH